MLLLFSFILSVIAGEDEDPIKVDIMSRLEFDSFTTNEPYERLARYLFFSRMVILGARFTLFGGGFI